MEFHQAVRELIQSLDGYSTEYAAVLFQGPDGVFGQKIISADYVPWETLVAVAYPNFEPVARVTYCYEERRGRWFLLQQRGMPSLHIDVDSGLVIWCGNKSRMPELAERLQLRKEPLFSTINYFMPLEGSCSPSS